MSEAYKLAGEAETALRKLKHHVQGSDDTQAVTECVMVVEILRNKYAPEETAEMPHKHD